MKGFQHHYTNTCILFMIELHANGFERLAKPTLKSNIRPPFILNSVMIIKSSVETFPSSQFKAIALIQKHEMAFRSALTSSQMRNLMMFPPFFLKTSIFHSCWWDVKERMYSSIGYEYFNRKVYPLRLIMQKRENVSPQLKILCKKHTFFYGAPFWIQLDLFCH